MNFFNEGRSIFWTLSLIPISLNHLSTTFDGKVLVGSPAGVTILGILHAIFGAFAIVSVLMGITMMTVGAFQDALMVGQGGFLVVLASVLAAINFGIAGALFSGRAWGRMIVIILAIFSLVLGIVSIVSGEGASIFSIILNGIILWYLRRPYVKEYFQVTP